VKITKVKFHNYRIYGGQQIIDFSISNKEKPVIVVGGLNGEGKTTMLEGIQIALYGRQSDVWSQHGTTYSKYLEQSIHRGADPMIGSSVEVEFEAIDDARKITISTQRSWKLNTKGLIEEELQVFVNGELDKLLSENWVDQVERFIPSRLAGLFFFDGEKIRHYADPKRSQELIRRGILSLLGIDIVDQLDIDLKALGTKITGTKKVFEVDEISIQLEQDKTDCCDVLINQKERRADLQNDIDCKIKLCDELDCQFRELGGHLFEKRVAIENQQKELKAKREIIANQLVESSAELPPLSLIKEQLFDTMKLATDEMNASMAKLTYVTLNKQHQNLNLCLNKEGITGKAIEIINQFFGAEAKELKRKALLPINLGCSESDIIQMKHLLNDGIMNSVLKSSKLIKKIQKLDDSIQNIDRRLASVPDQESISDIIEKRDLAKMDLLLLEGRALQLDEMIIATKASRDKAELVLNKHLVRKMEHIQDLEEDARILRYAQKVRDTLEAFRSELIQQRIEELQSVIFESYTYLMRKKSMVKSIFIDPDSFALSLNNYKGQTVLPELLSAGERQLLVVSILWGLAKASGRNLPIIVDTPLGRLDSTHRDNLVRNYYPNASHQVILLSTDEELSGRAMSALRPAVSGLYRLVYNEENESTSINRGYFEEMTNAN